MDFHMLPLQKGSFLDNIRHPGIPTAVPTNKNNINTNLLTNLLTPTTTTGNRKVFARLADQLLPPTTTTTPSSSPCNAACTNITATTYFLYFIFIALAACSKLVLAAYISRVLRQSRKPRGQEVRGSQDENNNNNHPRQPSSSRLYILLALSAPVMFCLIAGPLVGHVVVLEKKEKDQGEVWLEWMVVGAVTCGGMVMLDGVVMGVVWLVGLIRGGGRRRRGARERRERKEADRRVVELQVLGV